MAYQGVGYPNDARLHLQAVIVEFADSDSTKQ
jgi:hypothetical protein